MKIKINRKTCSNTPHFPVVNQWNQKDTRMFCTIYAPYITWRYNSWIYLWDTEEQVEKEIKRIAKQQIDKWLLSETKWWKWSDWVWAWEREYKVNVLILNKWKDRQLIKDLLSKWIALTTWIKIDIDFVLDSKDWELDWTWNKYSDWTRTIWHFTTIAWANPDVVNIKWYKYMFVDSYAFNKKGREWLYKFNDIDWFLDYTAMSTLYYIW